MKKPKLQFKKPFFKKTPKLQTPHLQLFEREHKKIYFSAKGNLDQEINNNRVSKTLKKWTSGKWVVKTLQRKKPKKTKTISSKLPNWQKSMQETHDTLEEDHNTTFTNNPFVGVSNK
jgi:mRNA-degrading endonuclease RelE of RelBE toxin-antitoxin system